MTPIKKVLKYVLKKESVSDEITVTRKEKIIDILNRIEVPVDGSLVFYKDRPVPLDTEVWEFDEIVIINVSSGG